MTKDEKRFWSKVRVVDDEDSCWEWTASRSSSGYGQIFFAGKNVRASRAAWMFANGPIPPGQFALHRCDNKGCVRPSHLFLGTQADNVADMHSKGRHPISRARVSS